MVSFFQPPVSIADGIDSSPIEYIFSYGTGSPVSVSTNSTPQCTSSLCQHTFGDTDFQVQQYNVSVAARNVVGVGNASTLVTIGTWYKKCNSAGCFSMKHLIVQHRLKIQPVL